MSWLRHKTRQALASRHRLFAMPVLRWLAPLLDRPAYWSPNRRKVALGVAAGLYSGVMPGFTQKVTAVLLTLLFRVNLPVAMLVSLYSNPFTVLPLYYLAYLYGKWILGVSTTVAIMPPPSLIDLGLVGWLVASLQWLLHLGKPLLVGMPALGLTLGLAGYVLIRIWWRWSVINAWNNRKVKRGFA